MRTVLFVHEPSAVTIRAADPRDAAVEICRFNGVGQPAIGAHKLERGIYLIVSSGPLTVEGVRGDIETIRNDKDEWPEPKPIVVTLESGASVASLREFLTVAKDISPHD